MKRKIFTVLLFAGLTCGALSAEAGSFHSEWFASRLDTAGTTTKVTTASATQQFCYLSGVSVEETGTAGASAGCRVRRSGVVWVLEATLGRSSGADARCRAICINN
jgi:hypothetical protein